MRSEEMFIHVVHHPDTLTQAVPDLCADMYQFSSTIATGASPRMLIAITPLITALAARRVLESTCAQ
jgi:hypothetical protein